MRSACVNNPPLISGRDQTFNDTGLSSSSSSTSPSFSFYSASPILFCCLSPFLRIDLRRFLLPSALCSLYHFEFRPDEDRRETRVNSKTFSILLLFLSLSLSLFCSANIVGGKDQRRETNSDSAVVIASPSRIRQRRLRRCQRLIRRKRCIEWMRSSSSSSSSAPK